jgi:hypothetical protein
MSANIHSFHLFGGLWLENPTPEQFSRLGHLLPLIQDLDRRTQQGQCYKLL